MTPRPLLRRSPGIAVLAALGLGACGDDAGSAAGPVDPPCEAAPLPSRAELLCQGEWLAQAARPLDASLPGARTVKTIIDRLHGDAVYFIDTAAYPMHAAFAQRHLDYPLDMPFVDEYFLPQRRFLLGTVTHYEEPDVWAYEIAPYDTASAELIAQAFRRLAGAAYFGARLRFHPSSEEQAARAAELPGDVPRVSTDEIYAGTRFQPLNLGETYAQLRVLDAADLEAGAYVGPREIAVLDRVPDDIGPVAGVITAQFQTPLSHVNVLSQQRGTPNMGLRDAHAVLAPLDGRWVRLRVGAFDWSADEVSAADAEAWWQAQRGGPASIPAPDYSVTAILDIDDVGHDDVAVVGGKAANYGELRRLAAAAVPDVRVRDALAIPVHHYRRFLEQNGFDVEIAAMLAEPAFAGDGQVRRARLADLQARMRAAPVDAAFLATLEARLDADFPATRMKFRSSTNAEDLERHTGAGLYDSKAGQAHDPVDTVADALRTVWASVWNLRAFEERAYAGIDHGQVAMAVLVNPSYRDEAANGVAITANIYDPAPGGEDAFYVNAQLGEASVVQPVPTIVADQLMYYYFHNGQPATYYARSNLVRPGETVMTRVELFDLGRSLAAVRDHFARFFTPPVGYGQLPMDVEWKLVDDGAARVIWLKQARPYPGRGEPPAMTKPTEEGPPWR